MDTRKDSGTATETPPLHNHESVIDKVVRLNPFYLLSVAFVIHGSGFWFRASGSHEPWQLLALLGGFQLILAVTGVLVVRLGKVWEDARSIFILLLLLTLEISISFDDTLLSRPRGGWLIPIVGWLLSAALYEFVMRGTGMRIGRSVRWPFHLMIGLLFLYPLVILPANRASNEPAIRWLLAAYPLFVAAAVLTLIPAVQLGRRCGRDNGTVWTWPCFPWLPLGVMIVCLVVRSYAMCIALDPALSISNDVARQLGSIFSGIFLAPPLLAIGMLMVLASAKHRNEHLWKAAACIPCAAVVLSFLPIWPDVIQRQFLHQLTTSIASPLFLSLISGLIYFLIAAAFRRPKAEWGVTAFFVMLVHSAPGSTFLAAPDYPLLLAVPGLLHLIGGWRRQEISHVVGGSALLLLSGHESLAAIAGQRLVVAAEAHIVVLGMLAIGLFWNAKLLLRLSAVGLTFFALLAVTVPDSPQFELSSYLRYAYCGVIFVASIALLFREPAFFASASVAFLILSIVACQAVARMARGIQGWQGLVTYAIGLIWLALGIFVSIRKSRLATAKVTSSERQR